MTWTAWIALGSNVGDRDAHLSAALEALAADPSITVLGRSRRFETRPVGPGTGNFLNAACAVRTSLSPRALLAACQAIEDRHGRVRTGPRWGDRTLDLDLLHIVDAAGAAVRCDSDDLQLPHPGLATRDFVLAPLQELAPELEVDGHGTVEACLAAIAPEARTLLPSPYPA